MKIEYSGVWPTMIAAFDSNGAIDFDGNTAITNYLIHKGSDGLFAVCQSSEMFMLTTEEKVALASCVVKAAEGRVPVIASGHTSDRIEDQIEELLAISRTGVDAVVLVSNRLAKEDESSEVFMQNLKTIMQAIPNVNFGIYECPYPYRRLLTDEELKWCAQSGRIVFLKDVSCDLEIEKRRVEIVKGTDLKLFNANTETLLDSLKVGYHGYNGVMGNFHIDLYKWMFENFKNQLALAEGLQQQLTRESVIEKYAYPINAKYHMQKDGVPMTLVSRRLTQESFTESYKEHVDALIVWETDMRRNLKIV